MFTFPSQTSLLGSTSIYQTIYSAFLSGSIKSTSNSRQLRQFRIQPSSCTYSFPSVSHLRELITSGYKKTEVILRTSVSARPPYPIHPWICQWPPKYFSDPPLLFISIIISDTLIVDNSVVHSHPQIFNILPHYGLCDLYKLHIFLILLCWKPFSDFSLLLRWKLSSLTEMICNTHYF